MLPDWMAEARALTPAGGRRELTLQLCALSAWSAVDAWVASCAESERPGRVAEVRETLALALADLHAGRVDAAAVVIGSEGRPSILFSNREMSSPGPDPWVVLLMMLEATGYGAPEDSSGSDAVIRH